MSKFNLIEAMIKGLISVCDNNEDINDLIGVLETTTMDAYDKRESIKEDEKTISLCCFNKDYECNDCRECFSN